MGGEGQYVKLRSRKKPLGPRETKHHSNIFLSQVRNSATSLSTLHERNIVPFLSNIKKFISPFFRCFKIFG
jgi:hypothetical protein